VIRVVALTARRDRRRRRPGVLQALREPDGVRVTVSVGLTVGAQVAVLAGRTRRAGLGITACRSEREAEVVAGPTRKKKSKKAGAEQVVLFELLRCPPSR